MKRAIYDGVLLLDESLPYEVVELPLPRGSPVEFLELESGPSEEPHGRNTAERRGILDRLYAYRKSVGLGCFEPLAEACGKEITPDLLRRPYSRDEVAPIQVQRQVGVGLGKLDVFKLDTNGEQTRETASVSRNTGVFALIATGTITPWGRVGTWEAGGGISGIITASPSDGGTAHWGERKEKLSMKNKNLWRLRCLVTAQTRGNLERLAQMDGCGDVGRMIDELTRDKMLALRQSVVGPWAAHYVTRAKRVD